MFKNNLKVEKTGDQVFILLEDLVYENDKVKIIVHSGFDFDGASIPKAFWSIIGSPITGPYTRAACVHDALYASELLPRGESDQWFNDLMKEDNTPFVKRQLMYSTVRGAGWTVWKGHIPEDVQEYKKFITFIRKEETQC